MTSIQMKNAILSIIVLFALGCKSKYEKAFEEIDRREYYASPLASERSREEIELLSNAIKFKPMVSALYFYRAEQYELFGEYEKAIEDYKVCIEHNWISGSLFHQKGQCELELKNYETTISDFKKALKHYEKELTELSPRQRQANHWGSIEIDMRETIEELKYKIESIEKEFGK